MRGSTEQYGDALMGGKRLVREAYILSIDHRRQAGNHSELCPCQISNRTSPKDPWWVKGLGLPWSSWLTDLIVVWGTPSLDGTRQKDLHFVPKSLIVLETGLVLTVWEASLERVTHDQVWLWLRKHHQIDYYWWSFSSVEGTGLKGFKSEWVVSLVRTQCSFEKCGCEIPDLNTTVLYHLQMLVDMWSQEGKGLRARRWEVGVTN